MNKTQTTRTLNPLPFEHMENRRFEDLVRQLAYDFRPWRQIEATGRSGSDDGFDARAYEIVYMDQSISDDTEDAEDTAYPAPEADRLWLIQCKREKSISPSRLLGHLNAISPDSIRGLHGILFVAACDFSKKTRDVFSSWCRDKGISEAYIWGKGELEDLLFQPKNDGILFAYFGISLQISRSRHKTSINHEISIKRKLRRLDKERGSHMIMLLRDPTDDRYPWVNSQKDQRWIPLKYEGFGHGGVRFEWWNFYASLDESGKWDAANRVNTIWTNGRMGDPWGIHENDEALRAAAHEAWTALPESQRAWFTMSVFIPYNKIIAIDEFGDDVSDLPHMHVLFEKGKPPIHERQIVELKSIQGYGRVILPEIEDRVSVFPKDLRKPFSNEVDSALEEKAMS